MKEQKDLFGNLRTTSKRKPTQAEIERYDCSVCELDKTCVSPKLDGYGDFQKEIMIIGEAPNFSDDRENCLLLGQAGDLIYNILKPLEFNVDRDCYITNVIRCRPPEDNLGTPKQKKTRLKCCRTWWEEEIKILQPKMIITMGSSALGSLLGKTEVNQYRGYMIPNKQYNTLVCVTLNPNDIIDNYDLMDVFSRDIKKFFSEGQERAKDLDRLLNWEEDKDLLFKTDFNLALDALEFLSCEKILNIDFETNGFKPYSLEKPKILTCSFTTESLVSYCFSIEKGNYWTEEQKKEIIQGIGKLLVDKKIKKVIQNAQFEILWSRVLGTKINNIVSDTMIDAYLLDSRGGKQENTGKYEKGATSQAFQVFTEYGFEYKDMVDQSNLENEKDVDVFRYNCLDTKFGMKLYQDREPKMKGLKKARSLFLEGQQMFPEFEEIGVRIDVEELLKQKNEVGKLVQECKIKIQDSDEVKLFRDKYHRDLNIAKKVSTDDMKKLLFNVMGIKPIRYTDKGNPSLTIKELDVYIKESPICSEIMRMNKLVHHKSTYLDGIERRLVGDRVHSSTNLHMVSTFRSSMEDPNLQNLPIRDKEFKVVRKFILPDEGQLIGEVDYKQLEVSVATMFSKDPVLVESLKTGFDMHKYWAEIIFKSDNITEDERFYTKNMWVFPLFYGSYYKSCLRELEKIDSFRDLFLNSKGKYNRDRAEQHLKECEIEFWETYGVFKKWRDKQVKLYEVNGYVKTLWNFRRYAPLSRNRIINTPIQGQAFHLLLDSMLEFVKIMKERKMKSRVMFEVHDSCIFSIEPSEKEELVGLVTDTMCMTSESYSFINVPLKVEWEFGTNWFNIKKDK